MKMYLSNRGSYHLPHPKGFGLWCGNNMHHESFQEVEGDFRMIPRQQRCIKCERKWMSALGHAKAKQARPPKSGIDPEIRAEMIAQMALAYRRGNILEAMDIASEYRLSFGAMQRAEDKMSDWDVIRDRPSTQARW